MLGLWLDPAAGLLRWAPVLALAFAGAWLLLRSRREHVAAAIPQRREAERVAELLVATIAAQWLLASFTVDGAEGEWFPGLPLFPAVPAHGRDGAWGMRHARVAGAVLAVVTLAISAWVLGDAWTGPAEGWIGVSRSESVNHSYRRVRNTTRGSATGRRSRSDRPHRRGPLADPRVAARAQVLETSIAVRPRSVTPRRSETTTCRSPSPSASTRST